MCIKQTRLTCCIWKPEKKWGEKKSTGFIQRWSCQSARLHFPQWPLDGSSRTELERARLNRVLWLQTPKQWPATWLRKNRGQPWEMLVSFCYFPRSSISWVSNSGIHTHITTNLLPRNGEATSSHVPTIEKEEVIGIIKERKDNRTHVLSCFSNFGWEFVEKHWQNVLLTASWKPKSTTWTWLMPWLSKSSSSFSLDSVVAMIFRSVVLTNSLRLAMRVVICSHLSLGSSAPCESNLSVDLC